MAIKGNEFDRKISLLLLKTNVPTAPEQLSHQMSELPNAGKKTAGPTGKANTPRVMEVSGKMMAPTRHGQLTRFVHNKDY
ncbi:Protein CBG08537 [Caenorhabditis briggsae]|uniref:Protein CBG08537 n=1 Tax=Caenorhabditis briggsae TaxID=6238 RepID=A8X763_CAEBR|nr:Protein CBG08537 [Caenorhabditis briggsae]CAP28474.1 Protein CBG08537 [Caenorhabditis briggsae]